MAEDDKELRRLNEEMGVKEAEGDRAYFLKLLHTAFVFRRANGDVDDKRWFLDKLGRSDERRTDVTDVQVHQNRAVVTAIVTLKTQGGEARFHNLRLFLKDEGGAWRLLAWANERERPGAPG
jgi:hypothetical protein